MCVRSKPKGNPYCPGVPGRSKVMVNPAVYQSVNVHGITRTPDPDQGQIHFSTEEAHVKEWPWLLQHHLENWTSIRSPKHFFLPENDPAGVGGIHQFQRGHPDTPSKGYRTFYHDRELAGWFDFVASRATVAVS